jgi:hypothetical protein
LPNPTHSSEESSNPHYLILCCGPPRQ